MTHEEQLLGHLGWVENSTFLLLLLQPLPSNENEDRVHRAGVLEDTLHRIGMVPLVGAGQYRFPHVVYAPTTLNDMMWQSSAVAQWRKLYLAYDIAPTMAKDTSVYHSVVPVPERPSFAQLYSPFHFDPRHLAQHPMLAMGSRGSSLPKPDVMWTGDPPITLPIEVSCSVSGSKEKVAGSLYVRLGVCTRSSPVASTQQVTHWARLVAYSSGERFRKELRAKHDCSNDHISSWPRRSRTFGYTSSNHRRFQVTLLFTPFERDQERTLVLRVEAKLVDRIDSNCDIQYNHV